ncbi:MAG: ATP-binding cassette domain-containing protein [Ignavibacteriota bacterium]
MVLLGGSGSGKSTLLRHIIGLESAQSGQILINGLDLAGCKPGDLKKIRRQIGVAFQGSALFNSMSVHENVALAIQEHTRLPDSTIELMVWLKLAAVGTGGLRKAQPSGAVSGMKKRAAVARALALDPKSWYSTNPRPGWIRSSGRSSTSDPRIEAGVQHGLWSW